MKRIGPKPTTFHDEYSRLPMSADHAAFLGEKLYFTGKKCRHGHLSPRYTSSSNCVECIEEKRGITIRNKRGKSSVRNSEDQALAEAALSAGEKVYKSKKSCPSGHTIRRVSTNNCVECEYERNLKRKDAARWSRYKKLYNLSANDFNRMMDEQSGFCKICECQLTLASIHVDHCHKSGQVRGLLCSRCNQAIGLMDEDPYRFDKAKQYLIRLCHAS